MRLYLVAPIHVEPTPDKTVLGRLDRILRGVGAAGSIAVRARMITTVAGTKFKTVSGLPVSLVGLQGKDDLLVLGPAWAVERLSTGESPKTPKHGRPRDLLVDARTVVEDEIHFLSHVPRFLACLKSSLPDEAHEHDSASQLATPDPLSVASTPSLTSESSLQKTSELHKDIPTKILDPSSAKEMLQALFRTKVEVVIAYFEQHDPVVFTSEMSFEASKVLAAISKKLDGGVDNYSAWWQSWAEGQEVEGDDHMETEISITDSGRHVTAYPVAGSDADRLRKPRTNSLSAKWREITGV